MPETKTFRNKMGRLLSLQACPFRTGKGLAPLYETVHTVVVTSKGKTPKKSTIAINGEYDSNKPLVNKDIMNVNAFIADVGVVTLKKVQENGQPGIEVEFTPKQPLRAPSNRPPMRWAVHH